MINTKEQSFLKMKSKGKKGESAVKDYYLKNGHNVIDVSEDNEFQKMDIDFIIDGNFVEVKTQSSINKSEKIVLEIETEYYNSLVKKGWFNSTEANILLFYDIENNIAYTVDTKELREFYNKYRNSDLIQDYYFDEDTKVSRLAYISIDLIKDKIKSFKKTDYNFMTA